MDAFSILPVVAFAFVDQALLADLVGVCARVDSQPTALVRVVIGYDDFEDEVFGKRKSETRHSPQRGFTIKPGVSGAAAPPRARCEKIITPKALHQMLYNAFGVKKSRARQ